MLCYETFNDNISLDKNTKSRRPHQFICICLGGETTTFPAFPELTPLGSLVGLSHGVRGKVFALGRRRLLVRGFAYDGSGPVRIYFK